VAGNEEERRATKVTRRVSEIGGLTKFTLFYLRTFTVGRKSISLYKFENDLIRPLGEERVHFALSRSAQPRSMGSSIAPYASSSRTLVAGIGEAFAGRDHCTRS
jgi:hypothetical protein